MTYEDMMKDIEEIRQNKEDFKRGKLKDDWTEDMRKNFGDRCDSQSKPASVK